MEEIAVSKFKAACLFILERVRKTRVPVRITKFGEPAADIVPSSPLPMPSGWLGSMAATGRVTGNIGGPASDEQDWEAPHS